MAFLKMYCYIRNEFDTQWIEGASYHQKAYEQYRSHPKRGQPLFIVVPRDQGRYFCAYFTTWITGAIYFHEEGRTMEILCCPVRLATHLE